VESTRRKKILVIAYHFPPIQGSSGYLRTLKFAKYLPEHGWDPVILTVKQSAYESFSEAQVSQIPLGLRVHRTHAFHVKKHLSLRGRYPAFLGLPDKVSSWIPFAVWQGIKLLRQEKFDAIFSTYPLTSAHIIGRILAKVSGLPWVADFRDIMWDQFLITDTPAELKIKKYVERTTLSDCALALVTTDSAKTLFASRYPQLNQNKVKVILNGFDEDDFKGLEIPTRTQKSTVDFVHAGLIDSTGRDPTSLLEGLSLFLIANPSWKSKIRIRFLAPIDTDLIDNAVKKWGLQENVTHVGHLPYAKALQEMATSDALLILLSETCNELIPVKFYEYIRIGLPILALTTHEGETAKMMRASQAGEVVLMDKPEKIAEALGRWVVGLSDGTLPRASREVAMSYSRQALTTYLASLLHALPLRT
jgi:glycosyltransferase involved in cell wall biosynthesis